MAPCGKPETRELADGTTATLAALCGVSLRLVQCDAGGTEAPKAQDRAPTHVKIEVQAVHLKEHRLDPASGAYGPVAVTVMQKQTQATALDMEYKGKNYRFLSLLKRPTQVAALDMEVDGTTHSLLEAPPLGPEKPLMCVLEQPARSLPHTALLSLRYLSPLGGQWCVERERVHLGLRPGPQSACCALM